MGPLRRLAALAAALPAVALGIGLAGPAAATAEAAGHAVLREGHVDVGPFLEDGALRFRLRDATTAHGFDEAILQIGAAGRFRIPASGTDGRAWEHVGPRGAFAWRIPDSGMPGVVWAGFDNAPADAFRRHLSVELLGHDGPGEVVLWESGRELPFWSTRSGLPAARTATGHAHMAWYFTEPGVHCLALRASGRLLDGTRVEATDRLTVVTESPGIDPAAVVPCAQRGGEPPVDPPREPATAGAGGRPTVLAAGSHELRPRLRGGALDVALVQRSGRDAGVVRDAADVVFAQRASLPQAPVAPWQEPAEGGELVQLTATGEGPHLGWSTTALDAADVPGDVRWRLLGVTGPGAVSIDDPISRGRESRPVLSSAAGHARDDYELWPRVATDGTWSFSRPGVYCVALEWSAELPGGGVARDVERLTFAVDRPRRRQQGGGWVDQPATLDPAAVTPCARADAPTGRRVLDRGHVDVATRLLAGELDVSIGDGTAGSPPVHRATDAVVLRVAPAALRAVPASAAYGFLGAAGDPVWVLPQVQDPDLLWPGWSTEALTAADVAGSVRWTLRGVRGPGHLSLWTDGDLGAPPRVLLSSRAGQPTAFDVPLGTHAHGSWGFGAEGVHCVDLTISATAADGRALARDATLLFAVGSADAAAATEADCRGSPPGPTDPGRGREEPRPGPGDPPPGPGVPPEDPPRGGSREPARQAVRLVLAARELRAAALRRGGSVAASCRLAAPGRCTVRLTVVARAARRLGLRVPRGRARVELGRGAARLRRAGTARVVVRIPARARRALLRSPRPVALRLTATAPGARPVDAALTLRPARR